MKRLVALLIIIWALALVGDSIAQTSGSSVVRLPEDIVYEGLAGTPQHVTLFGDPMKAGLYVDRIKFTAGTKVCLIGTRTRCALSLSFLGHSTLLSERFLMKQN
jgi:hypothetical protein